MTSAIPCAIALGSNLGDSLAILAGAIAALGQVDQVQVVAQSQWYRTAPVGPPQPDYWNGCAILQTSLDPDALMTQLLTIETRFGRERRERWGARLLDLDLLLYGDRIVTTAIVQVPHPRMRDRAFVLVPLAEIAPDWIDPVTQSSIHNLLAQVDCSGVTLS